MRTRLKSETSCLDCGKVGHWRGDPECEWVKRNARTPAPREALLATAAGSSAAAGSRSGHPSWVYFADLLDSNKQLMVHRVPGLAMSMATFTCHAKLTSAYMAFDTGCMKCYAGPTWIERRRHDLGPLEIAESPEKDDFRLGAGGVVLSNTRCRVPIGLAGRLGECRMSLVPAEVPGLLSQHAMRYLGAVARG